MNKYFLLFLFFPLSLFASDKSLDSLNVLLQSAKSDAERISIRAEIGEYIPVYRTTYWDSLKIDCEKGLKKEVSASEKRVFLKCLATSYNNIAFLNQNSGNLSKVVEYYSEGLKIRLQLGERRGAAESYNNLGSIYDNQGNSALALENYNNALKLLEDISKTNDEKIKRSANEGVALALNNIGFIYEGTGDTKKAMEYYQRSLKIREAISDRAGIAESLNNIGNIFYINKQFDESLKYHFKSLTFRNGIDDAYKEAITLNNIGRVYQVKGDFDLARSYYSKALQKQEQSGNKIGMVFSNINLASSYSKQNEIKKAEQHAITAFGMANELGFPRAIRGAAEVLAEIYVQKKDYKKALEMRNLYAAMNDSLNTQEIKKAISRQQFNFEIEKREARQKAEHEKLAALAEEEKQKQNIVFIALTIGFIMTLVFSIFLYKRYREINAQKNLIQIQKQEVDQVNEELKQQNEEIAAQRDLIEKQKMLVDDAFEKLNEKNKEVMDSIKYASRIQRALLPNENYIGKHLEKLNKE